MKKSVLTAILTAFLLTFGASQSLACNSDKCTCLKTGITAQKVCEKCSKENCDCGCEGDARKCKCKKEKPCDK